MRIALRIGLIFVVTCLFPLCEASGEMRYIRQQIPIEIRSGTPIAIKFRSLSGNGWNEVGVRCSPAVWQSLASDKSGVAVHLISSNKEGTKIIDVSPDEHKLWPVESFHYLFSIGGKYGATASVEITFQNAPPGITHADIVVLKTPSDTGL